MERTKLNYFLDLLLTVLFIIVAFTGFFMYLFIPEGVPRGRYQEYMGIAKSTWLLIHNRSSILLSIGIIVHIVLHKKWMCCVTSNILNKGNKQKNCKVDETK